MVSHDHGQNWCWPQVLLDSPIDDRDSGVLETAEGSLLVTTFTSLAYEPVLERAEQRRAGSRQAWPKARLSAWEAANNRLSAAQRRSELGEWMIRSTDGGLSWSARYPTIVNSPHGPIQLADGRVLYAGKELWTQQCRVGVCESLDDGRTWRWLAQIPARQGDDAENYHELHAVETGDGRLLAHIRDHNKANNGETLKTESVDGGGSWSVPHSIGVWGLPSFLLRLRNGDLLMTYGYRRPPLGIQVRLGRDNGRTWPEPLILSDDGASGDLGYPSTVELDEGHLLTVWYERLRTSPHAVLRQARWRLLS
jgi:sialidase-1